MIHHCQLCRLQVEMYTLPANPHVLTLSLTWLPLGVATQLHRQECLRRDLLVLTMVMLAMAQAVAEWRSLSLQSIKSPQDTVGL